MVLKDDNKKLILVIIFFAFIVSSIIMLLFLPSKLNKKHDTKKKSNMVETSNSEVIDSNTNDSTSNVDGSNPVTIITSNSNANINDSKYIPVSYFFTEVNTNKIYVGNTAHINVKIKPDNAADKKVTYKSDNPYVAKVSSTGVITGVSPGVCYITITVENAGTSRVQIQVLKNPYTPNNEGGSNNSNAKATKLTATFVANGSTISTTKVSCQLNSGDSVCTLTTPKIIRSGWEIIGWSTNPNSTTANIKSGGRTSIRNNNTTFYAITRKTITAKFIKDGATNGTNETRSCFIFNKSTSCKIEFPSYSKIGQYDNTWSTTPDGTGCYSNDMLNVTGQIISIDKNITFYAAFKHPFANRASLQNNNYVKKRYLNISKSYRVGNTVFDYEKGIPDSAIAEHYKFVKDAYSKIPWLFIPGKVFVMTSSSYNKYSRAYGLTTFRFSYSFMDIQYDSSIKEISKNATIHEMGHAWSGYYSFRKGNSLINQNDIVRFYNSLGEDKRNKLSRTEWFAALVTDYYWHYLGNNKLEPSYSGYNDKYSSAEKTQAINLMKKYINIANNNYK